MRSELLCARPLRGGREVLVTGRSVKEVCKRMTQRELALDGKIVPVVKMYTDEFVTDVRYDGRQARWVRRDSPDRNWCLVPETPSGRSWGLQS